MTALSPEESALVAHIRAREGELEAFWRELVDQNSSTDNAEGVNVVGRRMEERLLRCGLRTSVFVTGKTGQHLLARTRSTEGNRLLLLGHLDTVYPPETPPAAFKVDGADATIARGPGVTDMKGGLVVMIAALEALVAEGRLDGRALTVLLTADEEAGSATSHDIVAHEATDHQLCLVFETGTRLADGRSTIVTERRGYARYTFEITGVEAHSGNAKRDGVSAALEAAHKIIALESLNDVDAGVAVNVGVVHSGTTANTVPGKARLEVDCRFKTVEQGEDIEEKVDEMCDDVVTSNLAGTKRPSIRVIRGGTAPPLAPTDASLRMAQRIIEYGRALGQELVTESRGGASDGNITAAAGCPTVDGLGTVGGAIHSPDEWVVRRSLVDRAALLAVTVSRFYELS